MRNTVNCTSPLAVDEEDLVDNTVLLV